MSQCLVTGWTRQYSVSVLAAGGITLSLCQQAPHYLDNNWNTAAHQHNTDFPPLACLPCPKLTSRLGLRSQRSEATMHSQDGYLAFWVHECVMRLHFHWINSKVRLRLLLTPLQNKMRIKRIRPLCVVRASLLLNSSGAFKVVLVICEPVQLNHFVTICVLQTLSPLICRKNQSIGHRKFSGKVKHNFISIPSLQCAGCQQAVDRSI